jgi:putative endopeptidase
MSDFDPNVSAGDAARAGGPLSMQAMKHGRRSLGTTLAITLLFAAATALRAQDRAEPGVDESVHPGDDFFAYANGEWLRATEIPVDSARWTARNEINELTRQQLSQLMEDAAAAAPAGSNARKVADFRAAYLDQAAIDARGIAPLRPLLERIDGIHDKSSLTRLLGRALRADVDPLNTGVFDSASLIGLAVESGNHGEDTYVAYLVQGGLGLTVREPYLDPSADMQVRRAQYQERIARVLALLGGDRPEKRAVQVMALETAIAQSHASAEASRDEVNADNLWTRADFERHAPGMDWAAFFAAAELAKQESFVVWQPSAIVGAAKLVDSYPLDTWRDYLRFHAVDLDAEVLPRQFAVVADAAPRSQRALDATRNAMSGAIGQMYAERYFPPIQKARVQTIVGHVIAAFRKRVSGVAWLAPATKVQALAKLETLYFGVGYPEKWPNYSALAMDPRDAVGNRQRLAEWNYRNALRKIGQPADHTEWWIAPQTAGAVLLFHQNAYNFAAALLQPPKFDPAASDAANYGAIGAIVGHEVSHFVDTLGADYRANGRKTRWWTAADLARYQGATLPLVQQFSHYQPFPGLAIDGKATLVENAADLAGLEAAFDAHRVALGARANDPEWVRQQDRQFFIGFARAWRARYRVDGLRAQLTNDHAPETYRVATVRNLDAWYDAFGVRPGHRLYLEPKARVHLW